MSDKMKIYNAAYYKSHHLEIKARSAAWGRAHPEKVRAKAAAYRKTHQMETKAAVAKWHKLNSERVRITWTAWKKANPDKMQAYWVEQRYKRRGLPTERVNREELYEREQGLCHICVKKVPRLDMTADHIIPAKFGGGYTYANLRIAHRSCNSRRGAGRIPAQIRLV